MPATTCPRCGLEGPASGEGSCPRCTGTALEREDVWAAPSTAADLAPPPSEEEEDLRLAFTRPKVVLSPGVRLGAILLLTNALIIGLETLLLPATTGFLSVQWVAAAIDAGLALLILGGRTALVPYVLVRALLGTVFAILAWSGSPLLTAVQLCVMLSLFLAFVGDAARPRLIAAGVLFGAYVAAETTGVAIQLSRAGTAAAPARPAVVGAPAPRVLTGTRAPWTLRLGSGDWTIVPPAIVAAKAPATDAWVMSSTMGAHLMVVPETLPADMDAEAFRRAHLLALRGTSQDYRLVSVDDLAAPTRGRLYHTKQSVDGVPLEYLVALFVRGTTGYKVAAFTTQANFPSAERELMRILESFDAQ